MNTFLIILAVPLYVAAGIFVNCIIETSDGCMTDREYWVLVAIWPLVAALMLLLLVVTLALTLSGIAAEAVGALWKKVARK